MTDQELREQAIKDVIEAIGAPSRESVTDWCAEFTASNSVKYAVEQRALVLKLQADKDKLKAALTELYAVVKGECPSLLDEDSGGYAQLDAQILAAIDQEKA